MPTRTQSPPKRITRSRAKAVNDKTVGSEIKVTTQSARAASKRVAKRKTRADDEESDKDTGGVPTAVEDEVVHVPTSTQKAALPTARRAAQTASTKPASRTTAIAPTKSSRGRTGKLTVEDEMPANEGPRGPVEAPLTRTTRGHANSTSGPLPTTEGAARRVATKKKVTFQDGESDKENIDENGLKARLAGAVDGEKARPKQTAVKTKPARTPAARGGKTARGGRSQSGLRANVTSKSEPLSPKKNTQVSVQNAEHNKDRQALIPMNVSQASPVMTNPAHPMDALPLPIIQSPTKMQLLEPDADIDELQSSVALFTSPAKRLPPTATTSPSKIISSPQVRSMNQSPRKFTNSVIAVASDLSAVGHSESVLSKPAKKFPMNASVKQPVFEVSSQSELKNMMFTSPPKRPASPVKELRFGPTAKPSPTSVLKAMTSSGVTGTPRRLFSPTKGVTSAFRASVVTPKVHKMSPEEQAQMFEDELNNALSPSSTIKSAGQATPTSSKHASRIPIRSPPKSPERLSAQEQEKLPGTPLECNRESPHEKRMDRSIQSDTKNSDSPLPLMQVRSIVPVYEDDSEDELFASETTTGYERTKRKSIIMTPKSLTGARESTGGPMTALAKQLGGWKVTSPDNRMLEGQKREDAVLSPLAARITDCSTTVSPASTVISTPLPTSYFEEAIAIHEDTEDDMKDPEEAQLEESVFRQSQISDASQEYGDENAVPIDPLLLQSPQNNAFCTPERLFNGGPRLMHTISKVPLKPAADDGSPQVKIARRGHSLYGALSPQAELDLGMFRQLNPPATKEHEAARVADHGGERVSRFFEQLDETERLDEAPMMHMPLTPAAKPSTVSMGFTPARTPRPDINSSLLFGANVYVDVHTTEGADASGIFVELLTQMGAKCVKHWNWNPQVGAENLSTISDPAEAGTSAIGITHVVFKDGGKRTMEKVREAKGVVLCVGVGWVLDCEKRNEWCNEAEYAIDTSTIPRGGHRRRKSMEPRLLSNTFSPFKSATPAKVNPTKEFLNLGSPTPQRSTKQFSSEDRRIPSTSHSPPIDASIQATPVRDYLVSDAELGLTTPSAGLDYMDSSFDSPTTPYFLHPQELVQQTCPPKQTQQLLFPMSGRIDDQPNEHIRQRLLLARRKSLQWAPRVASPLSRGTSYQ